jgi:hypothetical protein
MIPAEYMERRPGGESLRTFLSIVKGKRFDGSIPG